MARISRALISVYDKKNVVEFARSLSSLGIEILSSGGTAATLFEAGIQVKETSEITGFSQLLEGRVKTLHPKIHAGILADRDKKEHIQEVEKEGVPLIDIVVVNLYPFEQNIGRAKLEEMVELVDIGGPTLVRSAAKNSRYVAVVVDPDDYDVVLEELKKNRELSGETLQRLAVKAWEHVSHYDVVIEKYFRQQSGGKTYPDVLNLTFRKKQNLRYGENPHQTAAYYSDDGSPLVSAEQLQGKVLSYNNILDAESAFRLALEFGKPTAVIVKHNNPCGIATNSSLEKAFTLARSTDPEAAFGGIVAVNRPVEKKLAELITSKFVEIVIAPAFSDEAKDVFSKKKSLRLLRVPSMEKEKIRRKEYRAIRGGLLVQDYDDELYDRLEAVTKRNPTEEEMEALEYAWKVVKYVKSNAVIFARKNRAMAIGAGQMKRVDAEKLAAMIAKDYGEDLKGCAMASDAFFPFRDGIDFAASLGVSAIIQPGGSVKDKEVIAAADEHGMTMVFTGMRHFRH